ncbi:hypothetical protein [Desulforhopalus sp. 52FAK]
MNINKNTSLKKKVPLLALVQGACKPLCLALITLLSTMSQLQAAESNDWLFMAEAYFWGASVNGDTVSGSDVDIDIGDLIDDLNMGFMGAFGVSKDKWSFLVDTVYLDVSDNNNVTIDGEGVNGDVSLTGWIVTPTAGYQVYATGETNISVIAGVRYLDLSTDIDLRNADQTASSFRMSTSDSGSNWDGIIGAKGDMFLNENWFIPFTADIGAGDSKFTWQVYGGLGYRFNRFDVLVAYRYLSWDFDDSDVFDDLNFSGFAGGLRFNF